MRELLSRSGLDAQLGFGLRMASSAVWGDLVDTLAPFGLKPQTYATLVIVETEPGCKQQDVADALNVQRPNMVALIDALITRELLAREVNATDRRSYTLTLTARGRALLNEARVAHRAHEARVDRVLSGADSDALRVVLAQLARIDREEL